MRGYCVVALARRARGAQPEIVTHMATILGLELKAVHVNAWVDWVFVHIQTDTGVQGLGELSVRPAGVISLLRTVALFLTIASD